jgi:potassium/hydrogen antiporter
MWGGLRGAVPIMLGTLALLEGIDEGERVYDIIFVVVAFSVLVQGTSIPYVAPRLGVPMRDSDPGGVIRRVVAVGSTAADRTLRDLPLGERTWVHAIVRDGHPVPPRGYTELKEGDELELVLDVRDVDRLDDLFSEVREERPAAGGVTDARD